jgi:uncharacterized protein DUF3489
MDSASRLKTDSLRDLERAGLKLSRSPDNLPTASSKLSNNIIQKGLAFGRDWSVTVRNFERKVALRSCPAGAMAEVGLRWCAASPQGIERRISMSNSANNRSVSADGHAPVAKPSRQIAAGALQSKKADPGSKQSRLIAMLHSPAGASIAAMMKATGWQQHSVRGFLAGVIRKRLNLKLSSKKVEGNRVYRIASAEKPACRQVKRRSS